MRPKNTTKLRIGHLLEWLFYLIGYTIIFILVTNIFDSIYIDIKHSYIYSILIVFIISLLNKTIKPILVTLTIPITGVTLGLFYPFINLFILKLVDWIMGPFFQLNSFWVALLVAVLLSMINFIVEELILKPVVEGIKKKWKE
ncbi:MAG: phage holin family protein [Bacilli bacterium]|nr:phage holin family protein [Bacilli bacterium]